MKFNQVQKYSINIYTMQNIAVASDGTCYVICPSLGKSQYDYNIYKKGPADEFFTYFTSIEPADTSGPGCAALAVDSSDRLWLAYTLPATYKGNHDLYLVAFESDGSVYYGETAIGETTTYHHTGIVMQFDGNGKLWIFYMRCSNTSYANSRIRFLRRNADGSSLTAPSACSSQTTSTFYPAITIDGNGRVWIAWYYGSDQKEYAKIYKTDATEYKAEFAFYTPGLPTKSRWSLITDTNGLVWGFTIARHAGDLEYRPYYVVYATDGSVSQAFSLLGTFTGNQCQYCAGYKGADNYMYLLFSTTDGTYSKLFITKIDTDYNITIDSVCIIISGTFTYLMTSWTKNNNAGNYLYFTTQYTGLEANGVIEIEIDTTLDTKSAYAQMGLLE